MLPNNADHDKIAEVVLALLGLTARRRGGEASVQRGLDGALLDLLTERGWIEGTNGSPKSLLLSDEGERLARRLFDKHFTDVEPTFEPAAETIPELVHRHARNLLDRFVDRVPPHARNEISFGYEFEGLHVTVFESRPTFNSKGGWQRGAASRADLTHRPVARFDYDPTLGEWAVFARVQDEWRTYDLAPPCRALDELLRAVDEDQTGIFFG